MALCVDSYLGTRHQLRFSFPLLTPCCSAPASISGHRRRWPRYPHAMVMAVIDLFSLPTPRISTGTAARGLSQFGRMIACGPNWQNARHPYELVSKRSARPRALAWCHPPQCSRLFKHPSFAALCSFDNKTKERDERRESRSTRNSIAMCEERCHTCCSTTSFFGDCLSSRWLSPNKSHSVSFLTNISLQN